MKKVLFWAMATWVAVAPMAAKRQPKPQEVDSLGRKIKTGWNFGILPSVAYDADYGFQGGLLSNVYFYGDGKQYPEYIHSLYFEAAYTTNHHGIFRFNYDSKYLIPNHRLTLDATYLPDALCDFYGYNGYQSVYHYDVQNYFAPTDTTEMYRCFYKYKRDLIRVAADIEGTIYKDLKWNAGIGLLGYIVDTCSRNPYQGGLYGLYQQWGLIGKDEQNGGWHPYARVGITYDTRDRRVGATKGIYTDVFFTYSAAFNAAYGQQAAAGYNHLQFNFTFRHYVPILNRDKQWWSNITFAYRIGTQNNIAGSSPFYMNNYLNTLFIQRVLYEGLGGANSLRGTMCNRLLANGFLYANVEFRFRMVNFDIGRQHFFVAFSPFFDLGMVTQPYDIEQLSLERTGITLQQNVEASGYKYSDFFTSDKKDIYRPHMSAGLGLKIGMNENFILSVDWAMPFDKQDNQKWANFYVKMGYLF